MIEREIQNQLEFFHNKIADNNFQQRHILHETGELTPEYVKLGLECCEFEKEISRLIWIHAGLLS